MRHALRSFGLAHSAIARFAMLALAALLTASSFPAHELLAASSEAQTQAITLAKASEKLNSSLSFIPNRGQTNPQVQFTARTGSSTIFFTPNEVVFGILPSQYEEALRSREGSVKEEKNQKKIDDALKHPGTVLRLRFDGADAASIVGIDQTQQQVSYFIGNDSSQWQSNLPTYTGITYQQLYPGIDLHYQSAEGKLKSTYTIAAGTDPSLLRWRYDGAKSVRIDKDGNLVVKLAAPKGQDKEDRSVVEQAPTAWQDINGERIPVSTSFSVADDSSVSFAVGSYDWAYPLTIDPLLTYSSYLGGLSGDEGRAIAADSSQNIYVTGYTASSNFPHTSNAYDGTSVDTDAFLTKIQNGVVVYSTFLGGDSGSPSTDIAADIAVDTSGNIYIVGSSAASNFPTPNGYDAFNDNPGTYDVFVAKLNLSYSGTAVLRYATYLGGTGSDVAQGIAISGTRVYVTGQTNSGTSGTTKYPIKSVYYTNYRGGTNDAFISRLNLDPAVTAPNSLEKSSYLGGTSDDIGYAVAVDSSGKVYIAGATTSSPSTPSGTGFPMKNAHDGSYGGGGGDGFVTKLDLGVTSSSTVLYSTYLGGSSFDQALGISLDTNSKAYVTGGTESTNSSFTAKNALLFDTYSGSISHGGRDGFVAALNTTVTSGSLIYNTFFGGSGYDQAESIVAEADGRVTIVGATAASSASNFPIKFPTSMQSSLTNPSGGWEDAFIAQLAAPPVGTDPLGIYYSSYYGGDDSDQGLDLTLDADGRIYITGYTFSANLFPLVNASQSTIAGGSDGFVAKIFPELIAGWAFCRWVHTSGSTDSLYYSYTNAPEVALGQPWRNAYIQAVDNWNNAPIHIDFVPNGSGTGPVSFGMYTDTNPRAAAARTIPGCSGLIAYSATVEGNRVKTASAGVLTHELGHAQQLGHITSAKLSIMGTNPDAAGNGTSTPTTFDIELSNTVYP